MMFQLFFFFSSRRRHTRCALVTGVKTCALPIFVEAVVEERRRGHDPAAEQRLLDARIPAPAPLHAQAGIAAHRQEPEQEGVVEARSEERRVGKEGVSTCRSRW